MPLHFLVPSLVRVNVASTSQPVHTTPHPLHALLDQLLLSVRSSFNKYHVELPQILSDGGGAGEMEETMMWFAVTYEKRDDNDGRSRLNNATQAEGPWVDDAWRKKWLERMERREYVVISTIHIDCLLTCVQGSNSNFVAFSQALFTSALSRFTVRYTISYNGISYEKAQTLEARARSHNAIASRASWVLYGQIVDVATSGSVRHIHRQTVHVGFCFKRWNQSWARLDASLLRGLGRATVHSLSIFIANRYLFPLLIGSKQNYRSCVLSYIAKYSPIHPSLTISPILCPAPAPQ